jgi:large subunit ribosomal protein L24
MRRIRKGDDVVVLSGKDRGKRGNVMRVLVTDKVVVENVNVVKRHTKPNPQRSIAGGIVQKEMPIHVSNIALFNPVTKKADRVGVRVLEDGRKVRIFKSNQEVVDI